VQPDDRILLNDFVAQWREVRTDAIAAFERVGQSGWLILGKEVEAFEAELASFWGIPYVVGCGSGLDAIELGLRVLGLCPGDKVLTTPLSAFATTLAIVRAGGVPVFVDVDASGLIDLNRASEAASKDAAIKFLVPVHLYGHALDGEQLASVARAYALEVVEDCAQAIGAFSRGTPVGAVGRVAATSFYPTKNLGAMGDAGAVLCREASLATELRSLRDYGQTAKYVHARLGANSRLDELQAALMRSAFLPRLAQHTERRRTIAEHYRDNIRSSALTLPPPPPGSQSVWHLFPVLVQGKRDEFAAYLQQLGVSCGLHYPVLIPDQDALANVRHERADELLGARKFARSEISLPIHPYLTDAEVERVVAACNGWKP
jgi:dTDP-3-amino-3,4,6-trideoxy-alpha-D-glucose transaminase